jgi:hypothetical protein
MREFKDSVTGHSKPEATQLSELPPAPNQDHAPTAARENETVH